jgi:hypothetical protein
MFDERLQLILESGYLGDLTSYELPTLREKRAECQQIEETLSYLRRMAQGELDVLIGEIHRRAAGGDPTDVSDLVAQLPQLLASKVQTGTGGRFATPQAPDLDTGSIGAELTRLAALLNLSGLPDCPTDDLRLASDQLVDYEAKVSGLRRQLHDRIDAIQAEVVRRYRDGEASVEGLLK